jgi:hypothetical protein
MTLVQLRTQRVVHKLVHQLIDRLRAARRRLALQHVQIQYLRCCGSLQVLPLFYMRCHGVPRSCARRDVFSSQRCKVANHEAGLPPALDTHSGSVHDLHLFHLGDEGRAFDELC